MLLIRSVLLPRCYLDLSNFILESGLSYLRVFTICLLLVDFVSAAGCHCFHLLSRNPIRISTSDDTENRLITSYTHGSDIINIFNVLRDFVPEYYHA